MGVTGENGEFYCGEERLFVRPAYAISHCRKCHGGGSLRITEHSSQLYRGEQRIFLRPAYSGPHCRKCHGASHSFLAPFRRKMRSLKKFRRRIGLGSGSHGTSSGTNNLEPMRFHATHGDNITLNKNRTIAKRVDSFCKGLTFSNRPVKIEEKVYVKLLEQSDNWSGIIRFGYTSHNPAELKGNLPKYACPDLTNLKGYWAKAVKEECYGVKDMVLYFYVNKNGTVYYGVNGGPKEMFFPGVDTNVPLWVMIDVYGNSTAIELVSPQLNNSIADQEAGFGVNNNIQRNSDSIEAEMRQLSLSDNSNNQIPSTSNTRSIRPLPSNEHGDNGMISKLVNYCRPKYESHKSSQNLKLNPLPFHEKCGVNIQLSNDRCIAKRSELEYCKGYVFSPKPIGPNEFVVVQILQTESLYVGGLSFGVINENPSKIDVNSLPEDPDDLMNQYCAYVRKNVANTPNAGDVLIFSLNDRGEIRMKKNEDDQIIIFRLQEKVKYWWFFDVYGSTMKICAFSGVPVPENTPPSDRISTAANSQNVYPVQNLNITANKQVSNLSTTLTQQGPFNVPVVLVVNYYSSGNTSTRYEPIKIQLQSNQTDANNPVRTQSVSSERIMNSGNNYYSLLNEHLNNGETFDNSAVDNGRNRKHQLQEWAKVKSSPSVNCQNECVVCCENPIDSVLYKCGHMCLCYGCAKMLWHGRGDGHCPYCRATIKDVIRIYKS